MKKCLFLYGCAMEIETETGVVTGNTYGCKTQLQKFYHAKWDAENRVWVVGDNAVKNRSQYSKADLIEQIVNRYGA